ncbi:MAG: cell division protein SepF, partial [Lachnospiraceae bacterium]
MGVLDKFLEIMKLTEDDDYDSDDYYDDDDDFDDFEDKPKKGLFKKGKTRYDDDDEDDDFDDVVSHRGRQTKSSSNSRALSNRTSSSNNKVTPMRPPVKKTTGMEVCVIKPTSVDDSREITETLLSSRTVILNLEGLDLEIAQRIIDFISGAAFAINGNLQKISNYIFLVTPTNVDIS